MAFLEELVAVAAHAAAAPHDLAAAAAVAAAAPAPADFASPALLLFPLAVMPQPLAGVPLLLLFPLPLVVAAADVAAPADTAQPFAPCTAVRAPEMCPGWWLSGAADAWSNLQLKAPAQHHKGLFEVPGCPPVSMDRYFSPQSLFQHVNTNRWSYVVGAARSEGCGMIYFTY